ncbi:MAG: hypothetical protein COA32_09485 [Fluviicola sp.]|nr:MAG: hypothetical protein COA32_09485 [Fluviicola sp.]
MAEVHGDGECCITEFYRGWQRYTEVGSVVSQSSTEVAQRYTEVGSVVSQRSTEVAQRYTEMGSVVLQSSKEVGRGTRR